MLISSSVLTSQYHISNHQILPKELLKEGNTKTAPSRDLYRGAHHNTNNMTDTEAAHPACATCAEKKSKHAMYREIAKLICLVLLMAVNIYAFVCGFTEKLKHPDTVVS